MKAVAKEIWYEAKHYSQERLKTLNGVPAMSVLPQG